MSIDGYNQTKYILGTNDITADTIQLGTLGDLETYINNLQLGVVGPQGPQGVHGSNVNFLTPTIVALDSTATAYVNDTVTNYTDSSGVVNTNHALTFGINKGNNNVFLPPVIIALEPGETPYITDTITTSGNTTNHLLTFGINKGAAYKGGKIGSNDNSDPLGFRSLVGGLAGGATLLTAIIAYNDLVVQPEFGAVLTQIAALEFEITTLTAKTTAISYNPALSKTNFSSNVAVNNGISDKVTLGTDGSISLDSLNPNGSTLNISTGIGTVTNIGNPTGIVNLFGTLNINGGVSYPFINQF